MNKDLLKEFKELIYQTDKPEFNYYNMIGIDHLIKGTMTKNVYLKEAINTYYNKEDFLIEELDLDESVEMEIVFFGIGLKRCKSYKEQMEFIYKYRHFMKSWMVTDLITQYLKNIDLDTYLEYSKKLINDEFPYSRRMVYVMGIKVIKKIPDSFKDIKILFRKDDNYYVMMGMAWLLSEIGLSYFDEAVDFLINSDITKQTKLKAISKMIDSFRITKEQKEILKGLRPRIKGEKDE